MVIIDTSVVYKWFAENEPLYLQAQEILKRHLTNQEKILIPTFLLYEIGNAWATKTDLPIAQALRNLRVLKEYNLEIAVPDWIQIKKALQLSKKYKVSVYDAIYAVLAKEKKCTLITADEKFVDTIKLSFIKKLKDCNL